MTTNKNYEATVTKPKKFTQENGGKHIPRFDFGTNIEPEGVQTATIKELLEELNYENISEKNRKNGKKLDIKSLKTTLRFFRAITGRTIKSSV